jgi:Type II secretory pathway, component PulF
MKACGRFPDLLVDMVMTGEISGNVDTILYNMEDFYKREANIKNKIKSASIYPVLILVVAIGMMLFFNFFIFPEIKDLFVDMKLPAVTIFVLGAMNFLNNYYLLMAVSIVITIVLIKYIQTIPKVAYVWDKMTLKVPVLGAVKRDIITSRFTRSMGIFLKSAVPIMTIMENMKLIVGNESISQEIEKAKNEIVAGTKFADSIGNEEIFEPIVTQMIRVGEETGQLDEMMFKLADIYDEKVESGIGRLMSLVEPVLTLVIGLIVGVAIVGVALPIMQMTQGMK